MAAPAAYGFTVFSKAAELDNTNYSVWKTKVKTLITYNGFWTWLTDASMVVKPVLSTGSVSQADVDSWVDTDRRVYTFILMNLSDTVLQEVRAEEHAHSLWQRITDLFEDKSVARGVLPSAVQPV